MIQLPPVAGNPWSSREEWSRPAILLVVFVALLTAMLYWGGLDGPFVFDDEANIVNNDAVHLKELTLPALYGAASSYPGGILTRPISMASFAANHYFTGLDRFWFKATNLVLHLATGLSLLFLVWLWLGVLARGIEVALPSRRLWVSVAVCAAWLLHPINLTSVLYVVQRMTSLSALFVIWGLILYAIGREKLFANRRLGYALILTGMIGFTPLAVLAKENGILLPFLALVAEWLLWGFRTPRRADRMVLRALFVSTAGLPVVAAIAFLVIHPEWLHQAYDGRIFSLVERLLTETRVLWVYLGLLVVPRQAALSLYHDDIVVSTGLITPWTTLPAALGLFVIGAVAIIVRRRAPVLAFGVVFFFMAHALESSFLPLEIAHEHRNYLPGVGILLALFYYLLHPSLRVAQLRVGYPTAVAIIALFALIMWQRAHDWGDELQLVTRSVENHPRSARWHYEAGRLYGVLAQGQEEKARVSLMASAREHYLKSAELDSYQAAGSLISLVHAESTLPEFTNGGIPPRLTDILEAEPVAPIAVSAMVHLLECTSFGLCGVPLQRIEALLDAMLANPTLRGKDRAKILAASAQYQLTIDDRQRALVHAQLALSSDPEHLQHRLNLAYLYYLNNRVTEAMAELRRAEGLDAMNVYEGKIETLKGLMGDLSTSAQ